MQAPTPTHPCKSCGAPLEGARYAETVKCRHCGQSQDNPACLHVDDEVLLSGAGSLTLGRVTACRGPNAIDVVIGDQLRPNVRLADLIPVLRADDRLQANTLVYRRDMGSTWLATWTAKNAEHGMVTLKHDDPNFQDPFFDKPVALMEVRVPAIAAAAHKRSALDGFKHRLKTDPAGTIIQLVVTTIFILVGGFFLMLFLGVVYAGACSR